MQGLNDNDIRSFVTDELEASIRRNPEHGRLVGDTVLKAEGVFLWVSLVVRSLRAGFEEGDDMKAMRQRVARFPARVRGVLQTHV